MSRPTRRAFLTQLGAAAALPAACRVPARRPLAVELMAAEFASCSREAALPTAVSYLRQGARWDEILGASLLAATREVCPQPMSHRAHALMMVEPAFQLAEQVEGDDRMLPVLFHLDYMKRVQDGDEGWQLGEVPSERLRGEMARAGLEQAMRDWDEETADRAVVGVAAEATWGELFELLWPFALRDYRYIGHKPIYAAAVHGSLRRMAAPHRRPLLRSLVLGLLDGHGKNAAWTASFEQNREIARALDVDWTPGRFDPERSLEVLAGMREVPVGGVGDQVRSWLRSGASAQAVWDGLRLYAAEVLSQQRGLPSVHLTTTVHAFHYISRQTRVEATRRLALLQAASWLPLFRDDFRARNFRNEGGRIEEWRADGGAVSVARALEVDDAARGHAAAQLEALAAGGAAAAIEQAYARLVCHKATECHKHKFAAAMFAESRNAAPSLAPKILAAGAYYLPVGGDPDAELYARARRALDAG